MKSAGWFLVVTTANATSLPTASCPLPVLGPDGPCGSIAMAEARHSFFRLFQGHLGLIHLIDVMDVIDFQLQSRQPGVDKSFKMC